MGRAARGARRAVGVTALTPTARRLEKLNRFDNPAGIHVEGRDEARGGDAGA
jgi:hypothetical protein